MKTINEIKTSNKTYYNLEDFIKSFSFPSNKLDNITVQFIKPLLIVYFLNSEKVHFILDFTEEKMEQFILKHINLIDSDNIYFYFSNQLDFKFKDIDLNYFIIKSFKKHNFINEDLLNNEIIEYFKIDKKDIYEKINDLNSKKNFDLITDQSLINITLKKYTNNYKRHHRSNLNYNEFFSFSIFKDNTDFDSLRNYIRTTIKENTNNKNFNKYKKTTKHIKIGNTFLFYSFNTKNNEAMFFHLNIRGEVIFFKKYPFNKSSDFIEIRKDIEDNLTHFLDYFNPTDFSTIFNNLSFNLINYEIENSVNIF